jgi:hypothetical protein
MEVSTLEVSRYAGATDFGVGIPGCDFLSLSHHIART